MATRIGSLIIRLAVEHGLLQEGLARSEQEVAKTTKAIQRKGKDIADFGQKMSLAVSLPLAALAGASIAAAKESADALGQVTAALNSMGGASGRTVEQLQALAETQMSQSLYDDDQILREVTANLLTFGNVAGEQFDRAQQAALDLAARLGMDLTPATLLIGKALNDPVKGVAALGRAGVQFSDDQKAMIASLVETGNVAAAQEIILKELAKQFGGAAKAARDADPGAAMAQAFSKFQEEVGGKLIPLLPPLLDAITGLLDVFGSLPEPVQTGVIAFAALAAVAGPVLVGIGSMVSAGAGFIAMLGGWPMIISAAGLAMNTFLLSPIGLVIAAVAAAVAAWYYWDEIVAIVERVGAAVSGWWSENVQPTLDEALGKIEAVATFFRDFFAAQIERALAVVSALLRGDFAGAWNGMKALVSNAVSAALKILSTLAPNAVRYVRDLYLGVKQWLQDKLGAVFDWVGKKIEVVTDLFFEMYDAVVGNSYVPDMVDEIGIEFARLQGLMVDPAKKATGDVTEANRKMAQDVTALLDRLFPKMAEARKLAEDLALIDRAGMSDDARIAARVARRSEGQGDLPVSRQLLREGPLVDLGAQVTVIEELTGKAAAGVKAQTVQIAESFRDMADKSIQALDRFTSAIKGGGFLDILGSAVNLFLQLGSTGLFGKSIAANINAPRIPGNANGTAFHPGGLMMVGERGPEILQVPRGGRVVPNHELREAGQSAIRIILDERTDIVEARIGRTVAGAAPAIMEGSAKVTAARFAQRQSRRIG